MDSLDVKILKLLWIDGRMPIYKIAQKIGISGAAVDKRLNSMRKRGELLGFTVLLNPDKILNSAVVAIKARKKRGHIFESVSKIKGLMHFIGCLGGRYYGEFWYSDEIELEEKLMLFKEFTGAYSIEVYRHRKKDNVKLDNIDWRILLAMKQDARVSFSTLSKMIGLSAKTVSRRWERITSQEIAKAYPIINRPFTKDIFWFSLFIEVDDLSLENRIKKMENIWRTSLFSEPMMIYGVFYAETVKDIDTTMEKIVCMEGVKKVHYEIIVEEKFYPDYLNYVAYKMGAYSDDHIAQYLNTVNTAEEARQ